jgi:hypothetical protein
MLHCDHDPGCEIRGSGEIARALPPLDGAQHIGRGSFLQVASGRCSGGIACMCCIPLGRVKVRDADIILPLQHRSTIEVIAARCDACHRFAFPSLMRDDRS